MSLNSRDDVSEMIASARHVLPAFPLPSHNDNGDVLPTNCTKDESTIVTVIGTIRVDGSVLVVSAGMFMVCIRHSSLVPGQDPRCRGRCWAGSSRIRRRSGWKVPVGRNLGLEQPSKGNELSVGT